jgi:hypothetical protein
MVLGENSGKIIGGKKLAGKKLAGKNGGKTIGGKMDARTRHNWIFSTASLETGD